MKPRHKAKALFVSGSLALGVLCYPAPIQAGVGCNTWFWGGWCKTLYNNKCEEWDRSAEKEYGPAYIDTSIPVKVEKGYPGNDAIKEVILTIPANAKIYADDNGIKCHRKWITDASPIDQRNAVPCSGDDYGRGFGWGRFTGITVTRNFQGTNIVTTCRNWSKDAERWCALSVCYYLPSK
jgi:hypothetical protein